jgi:hypothetical protein
MICLSLGTDILVVLQVLPVNRSVTWQEASEPVQRHTSQIDLRGLPQMVPESCIHGDAWEEAKVPSSTLA